MNTEILPQVLVNSLISGSLYALSAAALALTFMVFRSLNFAHGHLMMVGGYLYLALADRGEVWSSVAGVGAVALGGTLGAALFFLVIGPFARRGGEFMLVSSIGLGILVESIVSIVWGVNVRSLPTSFSAESLSFGSVYITPLQIWIVLSTAAILLCCSLALRFTPLGRIIRASSSFPHGAEALGIRSGQVGMVVFVISTMILAYGGILAGMDTNLSPTSGTPYTIKAFAAFALGGGGGFVGAVLGGYLLSLVENCAIGLDIFGTSIPAGYKDAVAYLVVFFVLLVRPDGLTGQKNRRV